MSHSWVEIDLDAVRHNTRLLASRLPPGTEVIAMVKSNAYGLGAAPVARAALSAGATRLGVAYPSEGAALREAGVRAQILVMGGYLPQEAELLVTHRLTPALGERAAARDLELRARRAGRKVPVHLHIDTGMSRLGVPHKKAGFLAASLNDSPYLHLEGTSTHFATADEEDNAFTRIQVRRFRGALDAMQAEGVSPGLLHAANSAAVLRLGKQVAFDAVRPGLALHGLYPSPACQGYVELVPTATWKAKLVRVQRVPAGTFVSYGRHHRCPDETHLGTVSVGYGDGYARAYEGGHVLIQGGRYPIVGRITMDHLMVDLGPSTQVQPGVAATLMGAQGTHRITATDLAERAGTIPYEVIASVAPRVQRVYQGAERLGGAQRGGGAALRTVA